MGTKDISKTMTLKDGVSGTLNKINSGTVRYKNELKKLKDAANSAWSSIKTGAATAATATGTAALGAGGFGLKAAGDLESYRGTLETVMKDTEKAGKLMQWASQFANITPFDTQEVIEGTVRLESYGISATRTMGSIGDMAAVMNKDLMQAIEAVADAQTGELERMKEFGVTKAMIQKKADDMFRGQQVINDQGQIVNQQKFNEAMFALMDERFKGGMDKQSKMFKGLMSTISGTWKTNLAEMVGVSAAGEVKAGGLFDLIKQDLGGISNMLQSPAGAEWGARFSDALVKTYNGSKAVSKEVYAVGSFIVNNWSLIGPIVYGIAGAFAFYKTVQMGIATWTAIMTMRQWALNVAMNANPIGLIVLGIAALITAGVLLVNNWETVKLVGMNTWNVVVDAAQWGVNKYLDFANFMLRGYMFAWDTIEYAGKSIWNGIISAGQAGVNGFIGLVNKMISGSVSGINTLIQGANKVSSKLGLGSLLSEISFGGIQEADFSGARANAEKPRWKSDVNLIPKADFSGAKFGSDSIMEQTKKAQEERDKKRSKGEEDLTKALNSNTDAIAQNTTATSENTSATGKNTDALKEDQSPTDIADTLLGRIERHIYGV